MTRLRKALLWSVVGVVAVAIVAYVARNRELRTLDESVRSASRGMFARLRDGATHYELVGPDTARTVVLLSGATVPFYVWDPTRVSLEARGFRVLRYDYFGRGLSDRPPLAYDLATFDRQLLELLDTLRIRGPVDVVGLSMGGVVATHFADQHPDRVRTVTLVGPYFGTASGAPLALRLPGVGEYLVTIGGPVLANGQRSDFLHPERYPDWVTRYEQQMLYKGFRRAVLSTVRSDVLQRTAASFTNLARSSIPILLLWGKADSTAPFARSDTVRAAFPRAEFHAIDGAAHLPHIEQAPLVDSLLVSFLRAH